MKLYSVYIVRRWHVKVHVDCDIGWRCHHLRRGLEGPFWGYAAGICHENLETRCFRKTQKSCGHGQQIVDNVHTQKILAGSSGSKLFCTGGSFLVVIYESSKSTCFPGFWFVAATPVNVSWCLWSQVQISSTGQGRRRRKPSQLSSGSDRSETRAVAWHEMSGKKSTNHKNPTQI